MKNLLLLLSFLSFLACKPPAPDLNKDGGIRYVLQVDTAGLTKAQIKETCDKTLRIIEKRLDQFGVPNSTLEPLPDAQIALGIPGSYSAQRLRKLLQGSAKLSFCETYTNQEIFAKLIELNEQLEVLQNITEDERVLDSIHDPLFTLLNPTMEDGYGVYRLSESVVLGTAAANDTARINEYLRGGDAENTIGTDVKFLWTCKPVDQRQRLYELIAVKTKNGKVALSGDIIREARKVMDDQTAQPQISVTMTPEAAAVWKQLTSANKGRAIAVVIDDQVYSYPTVQEQISGGQSTISGHFTQQEADDFVNILQSGSLPARLTIISEEQVLPGGKQ